MTEILKSEQGATPGRGQRQRKVFMAGQVAVSVMLFGTALLFLASLRNAAAVYPGMDPHKKLLVMSVGPGWQSRATEWCEQACARLAGLPVVRGATFARRLPLTDSGGGATVRVEMPGQAPRGVGFNNVGGNYFLLMGTRVIAGRGIDANDREGSLPAVVVSRQFARQVFGERNPLGQWVSTGKTQWQVVGVAEDAPSVHLHETPAPFLYFAFAQKPADDITLIVETAGEPARMERAVRHELKQFDSRMTVYDSTTLHELMQFSMLQDRFMVVLSAALGVCGFLLTAAGLFGVIQYAVNRRTREVGLRTALGALPGQIERMVLGESLRMAAWGIGVGVVLLGAVAWSVRSLVLGISPLNPLIYAASAGAALVLALGAAWWPAHRATRVDPMAALRME